MIAISPYTALLVKPWGALSIDRRMPELSVGASMVPCGDWNRIELRNAMSRIKDAHPKTKDRERYSRVALDLESPELHVYWPPETNGAPGTYVNPRYLLDGLAPWSAMLRFAGPQHPVCIETPVSRYYVATIAQPRV